MPRRKNNVKNNTNNNIQKNARDSNAVHLPAEPEPKRNLGKDFPIFLLALCVVSCIVLRPLVYGIAWGAVFAFLWHPVHRYIGRNRWLAAHPNICASLSFALLMGTLTIPLAYTLQAILSEFLSAYETLSAYILHIKDAGLPPLDSFLPESLHEYVAPLLSDKERIASTLTSIAQTAAGFLQNLSKGVLQWTGSFIFQGFIAVMTMFFMIRDGAAVVAYIRDFIPLPRDGREHFIDNTGRIMNSVAYGVIFTVGIQALLGGVGWWATGLPKAFLASAAMFIFGMLPMGTALVWLPGGIYLILSGSVGLGIALLLWGFIVVSSIDNILRPILIGSGSSMPTLALIIGLSGGIAAWGLLGVFLGPLTLALFLSVLDLYRSEIKSAERRD